MQTTNDRIQHIRKQLSDLVGPDLADSLVRAGRTRGQVELDLYILINDGVMTLSEEKRQKVLHLIDSLIAETMTYSVTKSVGERR